MSLGDVNVVHSFLSPGACWLVNIKGLSGAVKRPYCYIPAMTTATSQGFPFYNNSQLIPLNSQTTYLFGGNNILFTVPADSKYLNLCSFNAVTIYNTTVAAYVPISNYHH